MITRCLILSLALLAISSINATEITANADKEHHEVQAPAVDVNNHVDTNQTPLIDEVDKAVESAETDNSSPEMSSASEESQESDSESAEMDETASPEKRFYSWEGNEVQKRGYNYNRPGGRRNKRFYSWEGQEASKRSARDVAADKRKFYQWAGKRSGMAHAQMDSMLKHYKASDKVSPWSGEKKRKFYQWAGKRAAVDPVDYLSDEVSSAEYWIDAEAPGEIKRGTPYQYRSLKPIRNTNSRFSKRKFYSWAGKRSAVPMDVKRKFYSWAG